MNHPCKKNLLFIFAIFFWGCICHANTHNPQNILKKIRGSENEGAQIVQMFCATCHATKPMISIGAPAIHDETAWRARVKKGLNTLFNHTEEGYGAMPARGGCFECSDEQLYLAIYELIPESMLKKLQK